MDIISVCSLVIKHLVVDNISVMTSVTSVPANHAEYTPESLSFVLVGLRSLSHQLSVDRFSQHVVANVRKHLAVVISVLSDATWAPVLHVLSLLPSPACVAKKSKKALLVMSEAQTVANSAIFLSNVDTFAKESAILEANASKALSL